VKKLSHDIREHLQGEVTTLCRCWIISRKDGSSIGFTDHDRDLEVEGIICERNAGAETSGVEERIGLNINSAEVSGALQSDYIKAEDIDAGLYDNASISVYVVNWQNADQYFLDHTYLVGSITREDNLYRMELRGLASKLDQTQGRHFVPRCQADLGDDRCKVSLNQNGFNEVGMISYVQSPLLIEVTGLNAYEANWFKGGRLIWQNEKNQGQSVQIAEHTKTNGAITLQLWETQSVSPKAGDTFRIEVGCDKEFATCKGKFSNVHNFRGFPHMPGNQVILGSVASADNFDGGPLVP